MFRSALATALLLLACSHQASLVPKNSVVIAAPASSCCSSSSSAAAPSPLVSVFEVVRLADDVDLFADLDPARIPEGVTVHGEHVPLGTGGFVPGHYAGVVPQDGEALDQALKRLAAWVNGLGLPPDTRVALARVEEDAEELGGPQLVTGRTYLLRGTAIISAADVENAQVEPGTEGMWAGVTIRLRPAAAERFRLASRELFKRRIAILVDGKVASAPVIVSEIPGPSLSITMGAGSEDEALAGARKLADALNSQ
jgi:hypothetical protein